MYKNKNGYTIIELLGMIAVMSFLLVSLTKILINSMDNFHTGQAILQNNTNQSDIIERISRDIQRASKVTVVYDDPSKKNEVKEIKLSYIEPTYKEKSGEPEKPKTNKLDDMDVEYLFDGDALKTKINKGSVKGNEIVILPDLDVGLNDSRFEVDLVNSNEAVAIIVHIYPKKGLIDRIRGAEAEKPVSYSFSIRNKAVSSQ